MKPLFEEKQRYTQWWLWLIITQAALLVMGIFLHGLYVQLILKQPWGEQPMSDDALVAFSLLMITSMVVMLLVFFNAVLEIAVDRSGVTYRYFPLLRRWRRVEREDILAYELKTSYLKGYGVKYDIHGNRTISVKGFTGIEMTMTNGKRLTLGTQMPKEFLEALEKMKKGRGD
jgi:hypothetical protein